MNFSGPLSHIFVCEGCCGECGVDDLNSEHLCPACEASLQADLDAERAEELLTDDEIVEALLEVSPSRVVDSARLAKTMLGDKFDAESEAV